MLLDPLGVIGTSIQVAGMAPDHWMFVQVQSLLAKQQSNLSLSEVFMAWKM